MAEFFDTIIARGECPTDCSLCEEACAAAKADGMGYHLYSPELGTSQLVKCNQCNEPACAEVCPTHAITKSDNDGVVRIDEKRCVGCALCSLACPYGGIHYSAEKAKSAKCDNCSGEPKCIEACKEGVLSFIRNRLVRNYIGEDAWLQGNLLCAGCAEELASRTALRTLGKNIIPFVAPGCLVVSLMGTTQGVPYIAPAMGCFMTNVPSAMTGVKRYYQRMGQDVTCVALVGDGLTADVGFQPLSGAAERNEKILYICLDNEAYMNTGIQRSSTSPLLSWTTTTQVGVNSRGKSTPAKNVPLIMAFHGIAYVATASIAFLEDYVQKLLRAKEATERGMAYLHVLTPCATGWRADGDSSVELSRMAVETNYFPLWEAADQNFRFTYRPKNPKPVIEFTKLMGRFSHLTGRDLEQFQSVVNKKFNLIDSLTNMS
ncbi:4Fe-4S dicluster domain-containing protein [Chloroflexota bacterium]